MTTRINLAAATLAGLLGFSAHAVPTEQTLLATLRQAHPGTTFDSVAATPIPHVYEVWMGRNVGFVADTHPRYMIFGRMVDVQTMRDLTAPGLQQRAPGAELAAPLPSQPVDTAQLPLADAIATTHGDGSRTLYLFTDPQCSYCRQLEPELAKIGNVRIYNFMVPFQGREVPIDIWCAPDRVAAWRQALQGASPPLSEVPQCAHPIDRNLALAARLGVQGTPTLIFSNGERETGVLAAHEIEARLLSPAATGPRANLTEE